MNNWRPASIMKEDSTIVWVTAEVHLAAGSPPASDEWCRQIDACLARILGQAADWPAVLRNAVEYSLLAPGKRLRPMLVLLAAEAGGGSWERALPAACA